MSDIGIEKAILSVAFMAFLLLFGSRDSAFAKDIIYVNPSITFRTFLYFRKVPVGPIALSSILMQSLILITILLQVLSALNVDYIHQRIIAKLLDLDIESLNRYFLVCLRAIEFGLGAICIVFYSLICSIHRGR